MPYRWNLAIDFEENGLFCIGDYTFELNPTVIDMLRFHKGIYHYKKGDKKGIYLITSFYNKYDIDINKADIESLLTHLNFADRFCRQNQSSSNKSFDFFTDSDLIYATFVKNYPSLVRTPQDLQQMNWWQFLMLLSCVDDSISGRQSIRSMKANSNTSMEERTRISKAKASLTISERINHELTLEEVN